MDKFEVLSWAFKSAFTEKKSTLLNLKSTYQVTKLPFKLESRQHSFIFFANFVKHFLLWH
jgi:hypothetical protein